MSYEQSKEICALASYVEQFIQERKYLKGVSPKTLEWYKYSFKAFGPVITVPYDSSTAVKGAVIKRIEELQGQGRGNKNVSINTYLRCFKTFLLWCHTEGIVKEHIKLSWLKEEEKILATLTECDISRLVKWSVPNRVNLARTHLVALLILDTGLRISEALSVTKEDIDLDNLVLRVAGKGGKHRLVPFSVEFSKHLFRFLCRSATRFVFGTKNNTKVSVRDFLRDLKKLGKKVGITGVRMSPHTLRHSFAVEYLRNGGNLEYLRRILGHSQLTTTQKYLRSLGIQDLCQAHSQYSVLSTRG